MVRSQDPQSVRGPSARVHEGSFVFVPGGARGASDVDAVASVEEFDGRSLLVSLADAERAGLSHGASLTWVECPRQVLGAPERRPGEIGAALARAGIGCEAVAGARSEHLFVATEDLQRVLDLVDSVVGAPGSAAGPDAARVVAIREGTIRLGQFLKLAGLVGSGSDVKPLLDFDLVQVNGEAEHRRGRQLKRGDVVSLDGVDIAVG